MRIKMLNSKNGVFDAVQDFLVEEFYLKLLSDEDIETILGTEAGIIKEIEKDINRKISMLKSISRSIYRAGILLKKRKIKEL